MSMATAATIKTTTMMVKKKKKSGVECAQRCHCHCCLVRCLMIRNSPVAKPAPATTFSFRVLVSSPSSSFSFCWRGSFGSAPSSAGLTRGVVSLGASTSVMLFNLQETVLLLFGCCCCSRLGRSRGRRRRRLLFGSSRRRKRTNKHGTAHADTSIEVVESIKQKDLLSIPTNPYRNPTFNYLSSSY